MNKIKTHILNTPFPTIPELSKPAFGVLPKTGDAEPEDPGKPGWERSRTIWARSILAWRRQGDALGIDRHGVHSWRRLRLLDTLQRERWTHNAYSVLASWVFNHCSLV